MLAVRTQWEAIEAAAGCRVAAQGHPRALALLGCLLPSNEKRTATYNIPLDEDYPFASPKYLAEMPPLLKSAVREFFDHHVRPDFPPLPSRPLVGIDGDGNGIAGDPFAFPPRPAAAAVRRLRALHDVGQRPRGRRSWAVAEASRRQQQRCPAHPSAPRFGCHDTAIRSTEHW